jgi:diguanylate cyclase (GGDEF)-like protein
MGVLIVDDSAGARLSLQALLQAEGHGDVLLAGSAEEALRVLESGKAAGVEVILLDMRLPGMSGLDACRRIKATSHLRDLPILIITGNTEESALEAAFAAGASDYITKPVRPVELLARLRSALSLKRAQDGRKAREQELLQMTLQLARLNKELQRLTVLDELTGIANRRFFNLMLGQEWARAVRAGYPLALVVADIDRFKQLNDCHGHQHGDECLKRVAGALAAQMRRPGDCLARYGGEEFVAVLPNTRADGAVIVAEAMRRGVEALELTNAGGHVTISLGVAATIPARGSTADALLQAADQALYQAKHEGRNRVCLVQVPADRTGEKAAAAEPVRPPATPPPSTG